MLTIADRVIFLGTAIFAVDVARYSTAHHRFRQVERWANENTSGGAFCAEILPTLRDARARNNSIEINWTRAGAALHAVAYLWQMLSAWLLH